MRAVISIILLLVSVQALPKTYNARAIDPIIHEKRSQPLPDFLERERLHPDTIIPFRFALAEDTEDAYDHLISISDPHSASYGARWTVEQIHQHFSPAAEVVEAVKSWLESAGIRRELIEETASRSWLKVPISVQDAEELLQTQFFQFRDEHGQFHAGCDEYSLPIHLRNHIDFVEPGIATSILWVSSAKQYSPAQLTVASSTITKRSSTALNLTSYATNLTTCDEVITPVCIRALYQIPTAKYNQEQNILGVFEWESIPNQEDLDEFFAVLAPNIPNGTSPMQVSINGAEIETSPKKAGDEVLADLEMTLSLVYPQNVTVYQTRATRSQIHSWKDELNGSNITKALYAGYHSAIVPFLDAVDGGFCSGGDEAGEVNCGAITLPPVVTFSYGIPELFLPERLLRRACDTYMKLSLMGHTLIFSSGDYGVAGPGPLPRSNQCVDTQNIDHFISNGTVFNPQFPASCPFVTTVGATQLNIGESVNDSESAMNLGYASTTLANFSSAGGRSNYFQTPGYQKAVVEEYFNKYYSQYPSYEYTGRDSVGSDGGVYSRYGRAFPDVSANGANYVYFLDGKPEPVSGTSLAAPLWASIITLINQERTLAGKGPVGFINPVLYSHPEMFHDIVSGNNSNCNTPGFSAVPGWDAVTGLGTPNYPALLKVFMDLP